MKETCKTCECDGSCIDQSIMGHCKRYTDGAWRPTEWMQKENFVSHRHQTCGNCEHFWETDHVNDIVYGRCRKGVELHVKFNRRPHECTDWSHRDRNDPVKEEIKCPRCGRTDEYISESSIDGMSKYFCLICDKWFGGDMDNCGNCKHLKVDEFKGACDGCTTYPKDIPFKHWETKESIDKCKTCKHRKPPHRGCITCREADDGVYPGWESKEPSLGLDEGICRNCKYWHENLDQGTTHPDHRIGTCHRKGCNTFKSSAGWYCGKCEPKNPSTRKFNIGEWVKINLDGRETEWINLENGSVFATINPVEHYNHEITRVMARDGDGYKLHVDNGIFFFHENWLEAAPVDYMTATYMKKYALHPGHVTSITDGQDHYIGYDRLIDLYGLRKEECVSMDRIRMFGKTGEYIHLYPRRDGNYSLPKHEDDPEVIGILAQVNNVAGHVPDYGVEVRVKDYKKAAIKVNGKIELDDVAIKSLREQLIPPFVTDFSTKITVIEPLTDMERSIMKTDVESEFSSQVKEIKQEFDARLKDLVDDITDFKREWINREMDRRKDVIE